MSASSAFGRETFAGSGCSGSSGDTNRTLSLSDVPAGSLEMVYLDGVALQPTLNYTIANGSVVTFLPKVWDDQKILVWYPRGS